jgi:predicted nuclease with TOPRIM domain
MATVDKLFEQGLKNLKNLEKTLTQMRRMLQEYAETIDTLAREKEALTAELGEREVNDGSQRDS